MHSNYFAGLFKKIGNSGNSGNQTIEASKDAALQEADELPKLGNQWVTRVTELETELEIVTQVTQEVPSTGNQAVALETSNDAISSEPLPKLPKLPEKTSDIYMHIDLTRKVVEVAECIPVLTPLEVSKPVPLDLTREDHRQEALAAVKRGEAVRVLSATLGEVCYWVPDEEIAERLRRAPDYRGEVTYTRVELGELAGQSPELLRDIHQFKKTFGATLWKINQGVNARSINTVCFQRVDHPHIYKGDSEQDKAAVIQNLKARLTKSERRSEASKQSLKIAGAELLEAREHIEFLDQVNLNLIEYSRELRMQVLELEDSLAREKGYNAFLWTLQAHNPASGLSKPDIRLLLQLCHPDKHNGSVASEKATQLLLGLREARAG